MSNLKGWKMVRRESGGTVPPGTEQLDHRGDEWRVLGVSSAPEPGKSGKVLATRGLDSPRELYPTVFGLEIVKDIPADEQALFEQLGEQLGGAERMVADMAMEAIEHQVIEHGRDPEEVIALAAAAFMSETLMNGLAMAVTTALEYGRRQALRESAGN